MKSKRVRRAGHVARTGEMRNAYFTLAGTPKAMTSPRKIDDPPFSHLKLIM
jgi:hypothetical protein